ncbi:restriction endonuclease subunit S [Nicoletella semolina]|uniref:restriction endonuclease subunit S n=1 Tax=Nicoletella semolina TaxID=271160 RepID=UPI001A9F124C|nr:restriction endonuclease subunit S [Nicoletella semolina]
MEDNFTYRIDAEFFKKIYLEEERIIDKFGFVESKNSIIVKGGKRLPEGHDFLNKKNGIPYIRAEDIKNGFVDYTNSPRISLHTHKEIHNYQTKYNDVLMTIVGNSVGDIGIVKFNLDICNLTENAVRLVTNGIKPEYVFIFLLSKFGQHYIERNKVGTAQPKLSIERIRKIKIPILSSEFQTKIETDVLQSFEKLSQAKATYSAAETLLLETLGLQDFQAKEQAVNIKSFSETFRLSGRLDAEYYQEKYDKLMQQLISKPHKYLCNLAEIKKSIEPGSETYDTSGLPFIRVSDYDKFQINAPAKYLAHAFCSNNSKLINALKPKKGTILFSKDGTVGIAHLLTEDLDAITSGAILHLTVKDKCVLPEYLNMVLNSSVVQMQAERDIGGSIIRHWRVEEISQLVIPIIPMHIQTKIASLIQQSNCLRLESKTLLEKAKIAIELAIEKDEKSALDFTREISNEYNAH